MLVQKRLLVIFVSISCLLYAGIVFGFSNLRLVLERDGQFADLCGSNQKTVCKSQDNKFNLMYMIATSIVAFVSLPVGMFIDHFGPTWTAAFVTALISSSLVGIGHLRSAALLIPCFALLGAGGMACFLGSLPASFIVDEANQPLLLTVVNCFFDASSAIFLVFDKIHDAGGVSREALFDGYAVLAAVVLGMVTFLWWQCEALLNKRKDNDSSDSSNSSNEESLGFRTFHADPVKTQMRTFEFVLSNVFVSVHLLRSNSYLGMNKTLLESLGDRDTGFLYTTLFGASLPLSCLAAPCIGGAIRKYGCAPVMQMVNVLGVVHGACMLVPSLEFQVVTFLVYTHYRAVLYSVSTTFDAQVFGPRTVGTIHGSVFLIASLFNALQFPALFITNEHAEGDLRYFSAGLLAVNFVSMWFTYRYQKMVWAFKQQQCGSKSQQGQQGQQEQQEQQQPISRQNVDTALQDPS